MIVAAVLNIGFERTSSGLGLGLVLAAVGLADIGAVFGLFAGRCAWWVASVGLVPAMAAFHVFDAYVFGSGRFPLVWGIVIPGVALACLFLPSTRAFVAASSGAVPKPAVQPPDRAQA